VKRSKVHNFFFEGIHFLVHFFLKFGVHFGDELVLILFLLLFFLVSADQLAENFGVVSIDILVDTGLESFHEFFLDFLFDIGRNQGLGFSDSISLFCFLLDGNNFLFPL
jgi:hypothetical protein